MNLMNIFWRTFAQLFAPFVLAALAVDWATDYRVGVVQLVIGMFMAVVGGLIAIILAVKAGQADTAMGKAIRSALEKAAAVLGGVVVNELADFVSLPRLLIPGLIAVVGAFVLTYLQNQGAVPPVLVNEVP